MPQRGQGTIHMGVPTSDQRGQALRQGLSRLRTLHDRLRIRHDGDIWWKNGGLVGLEGHVGT